MKARVAIVLLAFGLLLTGTPAFAHHSFSSEFDINQPITLVGTLTKFDWVNPHAFLYLDVVGNDGKVVNWAVETGGPNALLRRGIRKNDFPLGIKLMVKGYRAKSGRALADGRTITLPGGKELFAGSAGPGTPSQ